MKFSEPGVPATMSVVQLRDMLDEPPPRCWVAFQKLAELDDRAALDVLKEETIHRDPYRRRAAAQALGRSPLGQDAVVELRRLIDDPSPYVVRSAIEAAAALRDDGAHAAVVRHLKDVDVATREVAIRALDALWRDEDFDILRAVASGDADRDVQKEAGWVLRHHPPADPRPLLRQFMSSAVPRERVWAAELMRTSPEYFDRASLEILLRDADGHVREAAGRTLAAFHERSGPSHAQWVARVARESRPRPSGSSRFPDPEVLFIDESNDGWFLLRYTFDGSFGGDTWHQSLEEAQEQATLEYGGAVSQWVVLPGDIDPLAFARERLRFVP